jgi:hypothetical protein
MAKKNAVQAGRHNLKQILTFLEELVHFPRVVDSTQNLLKSHVHCNLPTGRIEMPNAMFGTSIQKVSSSPQKGANLQQVSTSIQLVKNANF